MTTVLYHNIVTIIHSYYYIDSKDDQKMKSPNNFEQCMPQQTRNERYIPLNTTDSNEVTHTKSNQTTTVYSH